MRPEVGAAGSGCGRMRRRNLPMKNRGSFESGWDVGRDLARGMAADEMEAWFQPQVGQTEQLTGFEALLRWNHPLRGLIQPAKFIAVAEKTGLTNILGNWFMNHACLHWGKWSAQGAKDVSLAVNVSAVQLDQPHFVEQTLESVASARVDASRLTIEITETAFLSDMRRTAVQLGELRRAGMRVALDDFGPGYASLACLAALPIDTVKLEREFVVQTIAEKPAMLESVIQMAHRNGFHVVAEGVETAAQSAFLRSAGCDRLQGYYYGRPMHCDAVAALLAAAADTKANLSPKARS
jgi:EAL domain-containing protein (putative c-di-GMP-specific phosphodiesterase class I)